MNKLALQITDNPENSFAYRIIISLTSTELREGKLETVQRCCRLHSFIRRDPGVS